MTTDKQTAPGCCPNLERIAPIKACPVSVHTESRLLRQGGRARTAPCRWEPQDPKAETLRITNRAAERASGETSLREQRASHRGPHPPAAGAVTSRLLGHRTTKPETRVYISIQKRGIS